MPSPKDVCENDVEYPVEGESLVARHALSAQVKEDDMEQQRENIFILDATSTTRYVVWSLIGGSCTNVASTTLVENLNFFTYLETP